MTLNIKTFSSWQEKQRAIKDIEKWLSHRGKQGRNEVLRLSPAHCKGPHFSIAGQYVASGQNYWESPKEFDDAIKEVILRRFDELAAEAVSDLRQNAAETLINAEAEIESIRDAIAKARPAIEQ